MAISDYVRRLREKIGKDFLLVPSVAAIVRDGEGRILLVQGMEGRWQLPGGAVEPDEHPEEALQRECLEEANAIVRPTRLLTVHGGPQNRHTYANGDEIGFVISVYDVELLGGELRPDQDETRAVRWFTPAELDDLAMTNPTRAALRAALAS